MPDGARRLAALTGLLVGALLLQGPAGPAFGGDPVFGGSALFGAGEAAAQVLPRGGQPTERQELLLPDEGVLEITPELRRRLGLFPDLPGFRAARVLVDASGAAVVEVEWMEGGRMVRERHPLASGDLALLRGEIARSLAAAGTGVTATREGRGGFVLGQTLLGLAYHGWAVPVALDVDSSQGAVAAYLLTAGAAFYLPYRLTRDRSVSTVHRDMAFYGGTRGVVAGLLAGDLLVGGDREETDGATRARLAGGVILGAAGSALGFGVVDRWNPTPGDARFVGALGDAGLLAGAALGYLAGPYNTEEVLVEGPGFSFTEERVRNRRAGHAMTLAGHGAGLALGGWLSTRRAYAPGDVAVLRSAGVLGVQAGASAARLAGADGDRGELWVGGMLAGGSLAMIASDRWIGGKGLDGGDGLLVNAGHLAGGATAAGVTYLVVDDIGEQGTALLLASTVGSALGAALVFRAVEAGNVRSGSSSIRGTPSPGRGAPSGSPARFSVVIHPEGVLQGAMGVGAGRAPGVAAGPPGARQAQPPTWLTLRF